MALKDLTKADLKFIEEILRKKVPVDETKVTTRSNRFTGETVDVCEIVAAAHDFVLRLEPILYNDARLQMIHPKLKSTNSVSHFDRARYIVNKIDNKAYMTLLD